MALASIVYVVKDHNGKILAVCSSVEKADQEIAKHTTEQGKGWHQVSRTETPLGRTTTCRWEKGSEWISWEAHVLDLKR